MNPQKLSSHLSMSVWASTSFATLAHLFGESNCLEGTNETIIGGIHSHRTVKTLTCFSSSDCLYVGSMSGLLSPSKHSPHWKLRRGTAIMTSYDHCPLQTLSLMTWQLCKAHWVQQTPCLPKFTEPRLPEWRNLAKVTGESLLSEPCQYLRFWFLIFGMFFLGIFYIWIHIWPFGICATPHGDFLFPPDARKHPQERQLQFLATKSGSILGRSPRSTCSHTGAPGGIFWLRRWQSGQCG